MPDSVVDAVLAPGLWLGLAVAVVCSALFYGWRGGNGRQLGRDLIAGIAGFMAGQVVGTMLGNEVGVIGQLQLLAGILGAAAGLWLGRQVVRPVRRK